MTPTEQYAARFPTLPYKVWTTGQTVSRAGFGCYRVSIEDERHVTALKLALTSGINLIDTSTNYADGKSEELVGAVVKELTHIGTLRREQLVIITKIGYLQGQNFELALEREGAGTPFPEMTKYGEGLWHNIHPEFIEDQLTRSLDRMQLNYVDGLLLHNPEYFLGWKAKLQKPLEESRREYYRRIKAAFEHLENEVAKGRIRYYGVSSNTFPNAIGEPEFCSLETLWRIANEIRPDHGFRIVQLPMNLIETGAITELNQSCGTQTALEFANGCSETTLEFAERNGLEVLINRPLNAIVDGALNRLAEIPFTAAPDAAEVERSVTALGRHEDRFRAGLLQDLPLSESDKLALHEYLSPGTTLQKHWKNFGSYERWNDILSHYIAPRVNAGLDGIDHSENADIIQWRVSFIRLAHTAFDAITNFYASNVSERSAQLRRFYGTTLASEFKDLSLSHIAINALRATSGVSSALIGMRREEYIRDVLAALRLPTPLLTRVEWMNTKKQKPR